MKKQDHWNVSFKLILLPLGITTLKALDNIYQTRESGEASAALGTKTLRSSPAPLLALGP